MSLDNDRVAVIPAMIVDRKTWWRGGVVCDVRDIGGKECSMLCLVQMLRVFMVTGVGIDTTLPEVFKAAVRSGTTQRLVSINDMKGIGEMEREQQLSTITRTKLGVQLVFQN